jgi:quinol monooxygenase YgiN
VEILLVEFRIHPTHRAAFDAAIRHNAATSLAVEPGCRRFDVCSDPADADRFVLYEIYDDAAAVQHHLQAPHFRRFDADSQPWVAAKQVQRLRLLPPAAAAA